LRVNEASWSEVDRWVAELYGLGSRDLQVISDTLKFNLPYAHNKRDAQATPSDQEQERFCEALSAELGAWSNRFGTELVVRRLSQPALSPWYGIEVRATRQGGELAVSQDHWNGLLRAANDAAASEVILRDGDDALLIGRLAQRRYWSETQARLLAQRIAWSHVDLLKGRADA